MPTLRIGWGKFSVEFNGPQQVDTLRARWCRALNAICDPWSILGLLLLCGLIYIHRNNADDTLVVALLGTDTALLGGIWTNRWSDRERQAAFKQKAVTAIRGLGEIVLDLHDVEHVVRSFAEAEAKTTAPNAVTLRNYDEVQHLSRLIRRATIGAIEHWKDEAPDEADIRGTMLHVQQLQAELQTASGERKPQIEAQITSEQVKLGIWPALSALEQPNVEYANTPKANLRN